MIIIKHHETINITFLILTIYFFGKISTILKIFKKMSGNFGNSWKYSTLKL